MVRDEGMTVDLLLTWDAAATQVAAVGAMLAEARAISRRMPVAGEATPRVAAATPMTTRVGREQTAGRAVRAGRTAPPSSRE